MVDEEANANNNNNEGAGDSLLSNLFEKLFRLNQKLEVQEDDIFRLTLQVTFLLLLDLLLLGTLSSAARLRPFCGKRMDLLQSVTTSY